MSKDRARPFSRKHRKYWVTVTGGMLVIGAINLGLGFSAYDKPGDPPTAIVPVLPPPTVEPVIEGAISLGELPAPVMQAFTAAYPRVVPRRARKIDGDGASATYELTFGYGAAARRAWFGADGAIRPSR